MIAVLTDLFLIVFYLVFGTIEIVAAGTTRNLQMADQLTLFSSLCLPTLTMSAIFGGLFIIGSGLLTGGTWAVRDGRRNARQFIVDLNEMQRGYEEENLRRRIGSKTSAQKTVADNRIAEDRAWHAREVALQEEYLARPFYKQLLGPPFPDFAQVK